MENADKKKPSWRQRLAMIILSPLIVLLLAEAVLRVAGVKTDLARNKNFEIAVPIWLLSDSNWVRNEYDRLKAPRGVKAADVAWLANFEEARYIQYKLKPDLDVRAVNPFNDMEVQKNVTFRLTSNADGFRTKPFARKAVGTLRVVTIGDSSTFGWGVDPEYTWQSGLERRLGKAQGRAVEVLNLGISGHSSRHGVGILRHYALDLKPDVLVISYGANDARFVLRPADQVLSVDDTFLGGARWTLMKFRVFQLMRKALFSAYDPFKKAIPKEGADPAKTMVATVAPDGYRANLKAMVAEARAKGVAAVFLAVCSPDSYAAIMKEVGEAEGVPFVDARLLFQQNLPRLKDGTLYPEEIAYHKAIYGEEAMAKTWWLYVSTDGCHPNRAGTAIIADALEGAVATALSKK
jgi:lysophospholipase L1-like esterase